MNIIAIIHITIGDVPRQQAKSFPPDTPIGEVWDWVKKSGGIEARYRPVTIVADGKEDNPTDKPIDGPEEDYPVTVCDACDRASCWQGRHMCDESQTAGTKEVLRSKLAVMALEDPTWWTA